MAECKNLFKPCGSCLEFLARWRVLWTPGMEEGTVNFEDREKWTWLLLILLAILKVLIFLIEFFFDLNYFC